MKKSHVIIPACVGTVLAAVGGLFAWKKCKKSNVEESDSPYMNIDKEIDLLQEALDQANQILDEKVQDESFEEHINDSINRIIDALPEDNKKLLEEMARDIFHEPMDLHKDIA